MSNTIELTPEAQNIIARLGTPLYILQGIAKALDLENQFTRANIIRNHLTGKGPFPVDQHRLGERSHLYRKSVRTAPAKISGSSVAGSIGANVIYAGVHEDGFQGEVSVKGHMRTRTAKVEVLTKLGQRRKVKRKVRDVSVWGHTRKMNIPARRPLQTGVEERLDQYGPALSQGIIDAWSANSGGAA